MSSENSNFIALPVVNATISPTSGRPTFGSPEVAKYGAVGLDVEVVTDDGANGGSPMMPSIKTEDGKNDVFQVSGDAPLPIVDGLAHHIVDDYHLWIMVQDGKIIIAKDTDNRVFQLLQAGCSPYETAEKLEKMFGLDAESAWEITRKFVGRLAAAKNRDKARPCSPPQRTPPPAQPAPPG